MRGGRAYELTQLFSSPITAGHKDTACLAQLPSQDSLSLLEGHLLEGANRIKVENYRRKKGMLYTYAMRVLFITPRMVQRENAVSCLPHENAGL